MYSSNMMKGSMIGRTRSGRKKRSAREFGRNPFRTCREREALDKTERREVIRIIESTFGIHRNNSSRNEDDDEPKDGLVRESSKTKEHGKRRKRPHPLIVLGVNAIARRIERGQKPRLVVVLEDTRGNSFALSNHLRALALYKDLPVYSISKASYVLSRVFGVKNLAAFAVREVDDAGHDEGGERASSAVEKLSALLPRTSLPIARALKRFRDLGHSDSKV